MGSTLSIYLSSRPFKLVLKLIDLPIVIFICIVYLRVTTVSNSPILPHKVEAREHWIPVRATR